MQHHYKSLALILFWITFQYCMGDNKIKYPVSDIPKSLLSNADAVVREKSTIYEMESLSRATATEKYVITILKESALERSIFKEYYSKHTKIGDIEGTIYDADGKKVRRIKNDEIRDFSAISGFSLYDDSRRKLIDPKYNKYPFTVEYTYTRKYFTTYFIPKWTVFEGFNTSVQKAHFSVTVAADYNFRYLEKHLAFKADIKQEADKKTFSWTINDYKAPIFEPFSPPLTDWVPMIMTSPSKFELGNYVGSLANWDSFGRFFYGLISGKDNVPQETVDEIKKITQGLESDYDKVSAIYNYSQRKNRYVSIQMGIGGLQPFNAETVDRLSYGDCKALSNYVLSLLKTVGYNPYYTLVEAGQPSNIDPSFSNDEFNHVFLCVPIQQDTIWLECTNAHSPCGYIGDFTDDRYALLVKETGGELIKTPVYSAQENLITTTGTINLLPDGNATAQVNMDYSGAFFSDEFALTLQDEKDRKKQVIKSIQIPNFKLSNYDIKCRHTRKPSLSKAMDLDIFGLGSPMGNRLIIKLNALNAITGAPRYMRNRHTDVFIQRNASQSDTITYKLPETISIEALPEPVELESEFGLYKCYAEENNGQIIYYRFFQINKGTYPKEKYEALREFLEKVSAADQAKTMLIKST